MGHQVKPVEDQIALVRSVVGGTFSEMDIVRALHMANNDATAAINIIFDTPHLRFSSSSSLSSPASAVTRINSERRPSSPPPSLPTRKEESTPPPHGVNSTNGCGPPRSPISKERYNDCEDERWWFVGGCEIAGLSTCKGSRLKPGDSVAFSFPHISKTNSNTAKLPGRGRSPASCSEIVRFSTKDHGEIGRIPNEWARCLSPLVSENKVKIDGHCSSAPEVLCIMDTILLSIRVYLNSSMFRKQNDTSIKSIRASNEESTVHPLPSLFKLLGMTPFKNAEITPEELYMRKHRIDTKVGAAGQAGLSTAGKCRKVSSDGTEFGDDPECISDSDLDNIVGTTDSSELEEMDPPETLTCELRPYQKQALHWMLQVERRKCMEEAATTLHPCWDAYHLADKRKLVVYLNAFTGDATTEFPSTHQIARGGILADSMGLGKTIMTISLLLAHNERGDSSTSSEVQIDEVTEGFNPLTDDHSSNIKRKRTSISSFVKLKAKTSLVGGGSLIICPMTLLGQWKAEIETHTTPGSLTVYVHYGQSRPKDVKTLVQNDVVITTYGVLASEFSSENAEENGGLYAVRWFRIVLDEAHTIKSSRSQISFAAAALTADRRWCLTGTPIQNKLEDVYSLFRFLRVEPWGNWGLWHKLIQKPYEEGDERGLKLVQSILKPIMLRRTKFSTDKEGRPILVLPPADIQVIYCEMTVAEKDFYEALFKRSKVKFDQFVEQGRVLHNYASILELLLRLRQCCDHPFLVMSRGDTQEYSDLNKLAKRFLKGGKGGAGGDANDVPSKAYISEVVEELRKGEEGECPICLEVFEDAVLTPCAHRLCRECLFASWRSATTGLCPVCRKSINKQDLITAPTESRFQIDVNKNWVESSKISVLLRELENLRNSGLKSIIFSQWTAFLDLLQIPLSRSSFTFVRLDGTLSQQQREKVISEFTEDKNIMVLLMSLKAGGVGINLTAACNAFVLDPWWNPAVEEQAVMRIHRIGQTKSVSIKRFIVKGTVEERMEAVQARKQRMIMGALTDQEVRTARLEELKMLFT